MQRMRSEHRNSAGIRMRFDRPAPNDRYVFAYPVKRGILHAVPDLIRRRGFGPGIRRLAAVVRPLGERVDVSGACIKDRATGRGILAHFTIGEETEREQTKRTTIDIGSNLQSDRVHEDDVHLHGRCPITQVIEFGDTVARDEWIERMHCRDSVEFTPRGE